MESINPFGLCASVCKNKKKSRVWQVFLGKNYCLLQLLQLLQLVSQREGSRFLVFNAAKTQKRTILRKMMGKIIIFAIVTQSSMSEKGKKIDDEEKIIPRPEGYTIVKYAEGWMDFIVLLLGTVIAGFAIYALRDVGLGTWLVWVIFLGVIALLWVIGRKITEVKVNLKITDEGLEQTRLSGSSFFPDYRMIRWEDMRRYHLNGRSRNNNFLISVRGDMDFRISIPAFFTVFEKQKDNWENFSAFRNDFWGIAPEHDVHRAFFG